MRARLTILFPVLSVGLAALGTNVEAQVSINGGPFVHSNISAALGSVLPAGGHVIKVADSVPITIFDNVVISGVYDPIIIEPQNNIYPPNVTIDGGGLGSVFVFQAGVTGASRLAGFNITNGSGTDHNFIKVGGGIACFDGASPLIRNNVIVENTALPDLLSTINGRGGGVYIELLDSTPGPRLMRNMINSNRAEEFGGGVYLELVGAKFGGTPQFSLSRFNWNIAGVSGGGFFAGEGTMPVMEHCTFFANEATSSDGGGICLVGTKDALITGSVVQECVAGGNGGGLAVKGARATLVTNSQFGGPEEPQSQGNVATLGGGIYEAENFQPDGVGAENRFCNVLVVNNTAVHGGGMAAPGTFSLDPELSLCTFAGNVATAVNGGGAIWHDGIVLDHSILWSNSFPALRHNSGTQIVTNSNIEAQDPLFAFGTTPGCWFAPIDGYHLSQGPMVPTSPMVDLGTYTVDAAPCALNGASTHPDHNVADTGLVDLGYHYPGQGCP